MTDNELLVARDAAWTEWNDWEYNEYYPRWYKKGNGWINPWGSLYELVEMQEKRRELYIKWRELHFECVDRKLPGMNEELLNRWHEMQTPNGRRYVR